MRTRPFRADQAARRAGASSAPRSGSLAHRARIAPPAGRVPTHRARPSERRGCRKRDASRHAGDPVVEEGPPALARKIPGHVMVRGLARTLQTATVQPVLERNLRSATSAWIPVPVFVGARSDRARRRGPSRLAAWKCGCSMRKRPTRPLSLPTGTAPSARGCSRSCATPIPPAATTTSPNFCAGRDGHAATSF